MIRSRLLQAACCSLLTAHCWLAGCMQQRKSAWLAVAGSTAACTTCNKSGHRRTAANWQHLIASHVGPSETEREMPQNGTERGAKCKGKREGERQLTAFLNHLCICVLNVCVCARMQNFIWQICVISPAVPAEGSICASSEISPAAELQVEQTIRSTPAKLAASWRCSRVHAKGLATATAMAVAVALPIAAVVGVGVQVEVGLCLSNLMSK